MMDTPSHPTPTAHDRALAVRDMLAALTADRAEQAFMRGELLLECERDGLFAVLGFDSQDAFLAGMHMKRSTALSDKAIAAKFDSATHACLGIGRLRLLAAATVIDPLGLLARGVEVVGEDGAVTRVPVAALPYRALRDALVRLREQVPVRKAVAVVPPEVAQAAEALLGEPLVAAEAVEPSLADAEVAAEVPPLGALPTGDGETDPAVIVPSDSGVMSGEPLANATSEPDAQPVDERVAQPPEATMMPGTKGAPGSPSAHPSPPTVPAFPGAVAAAAAVVAGAKPGGRPSKGGPAIAL